MNEGGATAVIRDLARYPGERVSVCGLIVDDRSHHQVTGDQMKFITICDYTGIIECELFAQTYGRFGLETVRHPVVESKPASHLSKATSAAPRCAPHREGEARKVFRQFRTCPGDEKIILVAESFAG